MAEEYLPKNYTNGADFCAAMQWNGEAECEEGMRAWTNGRVRMHTKYQCLAMQSETTTHHISLNDWVAVENGTLKIIRHGEFTARFPTAIPGPAIIT